MSGQNIFMLGLCGLVLSAIGYFAIVQKSPNEVLSQVRAKFSTSRPAFSAVDLAPEPTKPDKPPPIRALRKQTLPIQSEAAPPSMEPLRPAAKPVSPHPAQAEILPGMQRSELLARFPEPTLQTRTIKDGDMIELIAYQRDDQGKATFAQLENGVVTRVYSGLSASRISRKLNP